MVRVAAGHARLLEPAMLVGGMVEHQIHDNVDVTLVRFTQQAVKVLQITKLRVDGVIIRNVIAKVHVGGGGNGGEPDAVDAELLQVIEVLDDAGQVADAVRVGVLKGTRVDLVDNAILSTIIFSRSLLLPPQVCVEMIRVGWLFLIICAAL